MKRRQRDALEDMPRCEPPRIVKLRAGLRKDQVREGNPFEPDGKEVPARRCL